MRLIQPGPTGIPKVATFAIRRVTRGPQGEIILWTFDGSKFLIPREEVETIRCAVGV